MPGSPPRTPAGGPWVGASAPSGRDAGSFRAHRVPGGERYGQVLGLCPIAASCIAVDVAMRWSADPDVREIARLVSERGTEIPLDPQNVYDYLPGAALAFKSLPQAMGDDVVAAMLPVFITGTMVFVFRPECESGGTTSTRSRVRTRRQEDWTFRLARALQVRSRMIEAAKEAAQLLTGRPRLLDDAEHEHHAMLTVVSRLRFALAGDEDIARADDLTEQFPRHRAVTPHPHCG